jgi:hypothetical protein
MLLGNLNSVLIAAIFKQLHQDLHFVNIGIDHRLLDSPLVLKSSGHIRWECLPRHSVFEQLRHVALNCCSIVGGCLGESSRSAMLRSTCQLVTHRET